MKSHTRYKTFHTNERRELIRITEDVQTAVDEAGVQEGMVLVAAMHITAAVWINDDEPGVHEDTPEWLQKRAPPPLGGAPQQGGGGPLARPRRLPPPRGWRGQRRRPPEEPPRAPPGDRAGHGGPAGPGSVAAGLLLRVRRASCE